MTQKVWACLLLSVFNLLFVSGCKDRLFDNPLDPEADKKAYEIISTISLPGIIPRDITFAEDSLWAVDIQSRILRIDFNSGSILGELEVEDSIAGIAYDGDGLWLSLSTLPQVIKIHLISAVTLQVFNLSRGTLGSMDYFNGKLYVTDSQTNQILIVNPQTGVIEKRFSNQGLAFNGIAFDGTQLWTIDAQQMRIYRMTSDGDFLFYYQTPGKFSSGICYAAGFFWVGDQSEKIFKLRFQ